MRQFDVSEIKPRYTDVCNFPLIVKNTTQLRFLSYVFSDYRLRDL